MGRVEMKEDEIKKMVGKGMARSPARRFLLSSSGLLLRGLDQR